MDEKVFRELNSHDLQLYYNNSFVRARLPSQTMGWAYIREFGPENSSKNITVRIRNVTGTEFIEKVKNIEWDFEIPASGVYNFKNTVIFFARKPVRHTVKALTQQNTYFSNILFRVMKHGAIPSDFFSANEFVLSQECLQMLFDKGSPPSFEKGMEKIAKKQSLAYALDSRISLSQGIFSKHPSIWLKERIIGELNLDKQEAKPLHMAFLPELQQSFANTGVTVRQI